MEIGEEASFLDNFSTKTFVESKISNFSSNAYRPSSFFKYNLKNSICVGNKYRKIVKIEEEASFLDDFSTKTFVESKISNFSSNAYITVPLFPNIILKTRYA